MIRSLRLPIAALIATGVAACSAPSSGIQVTPNVAPMAARAASGTLYVANADSVTAYAVGSTKVLRKIAVNTPISLALDRSGNLYVGSGELTRANTVAEYSPAGKLLRTISDGVHRPLSLALDSVGRLYVGNTASNTVTVYAPSKTSVQRTISAGIGGIKEIKFDAAGNLYVGNDQYTNVTVYAPGSSSVLRTISKGLFGPVAIGFDSFGNLYLGDNVGASVYLHAKNHFLRWVHQGAALSSGLAVDAANKLYIENWGNGANDSSVTVYAARSARLIRTISEGVNDPLGLGFDKTGNLYVANHGSNAVTVYAPGSTTPLQTIMQGVKAPIALIVGP